MVERFLPGFATGSAVAWLIAVALIHLSGCRQHSMTIPRTISFDRVTVHQDGPTAPWGKSVGDIDGNGRPDLVVGGHGGGGWSGTRIRIGTST